MSRKRKSRKGWSGSSRSDEAVDRGVNGGAEMCQIGSGRLKSRLAVAVVFTFAASGLAAPASAQWRAKDMEWPTYAADLAGTRYRPFDQVNATNFNDLEIAWRIKTDNFGNRPEYKLEGTPLMVNGVLYATAGSRRAVIALDPES